MPPTDLNKNYVVAENVVCVRGEKWLHVSFDFACPNCSGGVRHWTHEFFQRGSHR